MIALVGYTGFVGSNIYAAAGEKIEAVYNSKNIENAYGTCPDVLIYAGVRAEKFLANREPQKDLEVIEQAEINIKKINPRRVVLISTIDVFKNPWNVNENSSVDTENLHAYGFNRYQLEVWVRKRYPDALIIRLPGLFGKNIKKNFIYDFINLVPSMLNQKVFLELSEEKPELREYYKLMDNGFYKLCGNGMDKDYLKVLFRQIGFTALNFTDSRSVYQYYNLAHLWDDIQRALDNNILLWHAATEPISAGALYEYLTGERFVNYLAAEPMHYDCRTVHGETFGSDGVYIENAATIMEEIKKFITEER